MYDKFWADLLNVVKKANGHTVANCPFCDEDGGHFYANNQTGQWDCKKCQVSGNAWTFLRNHKQMDSRQIYKQFEKYGINQDWQTESQSSSKPMLFDRKDIEYYCSKLPDDKLVEFARERGLTIEILKKHQLGINDSGEFTLPVVDDNGYIRNILRKKPGQSTISCKGGEAVLFGIEDIFSSSKEIFVVEGPWSALVLKERGFKAVGTCGAGILKEEQIPLFRDKEVFLVPDNDDAGLKGVDKIAQKLKTLAKYVYVINLPVPEKEDVRNFFNQGGTKEQFEELIKQAVSTRVNQFPLSLVEFFKKDIPPVEYYVMDIIQKKGKSMVSAAPNIGKSIFVQNMALEIVSGGQVFMDKFDISPAKVLYLDLEMGESALKERFQKMVGSRTDCLENLYIKYIPSLDLLNDESKSLIESWLSELKIQVLILDPLGNAWSGDESKQELVGKLTAYLNTLIERFGVSILVVHHWRKVTKDFKSGGQMAAGSYKWEAWLDCHITLEGASSNITVSSHKNRNRPRFNPFLAKLKSETLGFEFITDFQKKFDENTLQNIFDGFGKDRVSIPDLIKSARDQKICSETTLRDLVEATTLFDVDRTGKTHYLKRKGPVEDLFGVVNNDDG